MASEKYPLSAVTPAGTPTFVITCSTRGCSCCLSFGAATTSAATINNNPIGVAVDPATGDVLIADQGNQRIRRVVAATGQIQTVAGTGGPGYTVVTSPSEPPGTVPRRGDLSVTGTVLNQGTGAAANSVTRYYLSTDGVARTRILNGSRSAGALGPSQTSTGTVTVTVPNGTALGGPRSRGQGDEGIMGPGRRPAAPPPVRRPRVGADDERAAGPAGRRRRGHGDPGGARGHVVLRVRDLERSARFYREVIGLREVARGDFGGLMAFFSATGANHHDLAVFEVGADAAAAPRRGVGLEHVALKIGSSLEELRRARAHLEAHGVADLRVADHRVSQSIDLRDPDGNGLELYATSGEWGRAVTCAASWSTGRSSRWPLPEACTAAC
jgi:catechol 2,3-dioxygenase-like lactoylglutathione lyase family enzyme